MARVNIPLDERAEGSLFGNRSFLLMWSSVAASGFGDRVIMLAALTLMAGIAQDAERTSLQAGLNFFFFLPYLLLGVPAGWIADKLPRKWIMLFCDESRAAILLTAFLLVPASGVAFAPQDHHWKIFAIMLAVGCMAAIFNPARNATVPQIVPLKQLQSANALIVGIAVIASLIGLTVGGWIIDPRDSGTVKICLLIGVMFYAVSGTFFAFLRLRKRPSSLDKPRKKDRAMAWKYMRDHKVIWLLLLIDATVWGAAMVVYNSTLGLCSELYHIPPEKIYEYFAYMGSAVGAGMLVGAIFVSWMNIRRESSMVAMMSLFMAGVCTLLLAAVPVFAIGIVLAFGVGFFGNITIISITTMLQSISPNFIRGRIMGLHTIFSTATNVAVNLIIWRMTDADKKIIVVLWFLAALLCLVALFGFYIEIRRGPNNDPIANFMWRITRVFLMVWHRAEFIGKSNIPSSSGAILASNHTTAIDPFLIQSASPRIIRWVMLRSFRFKLLEPMWRRIQPVFLERNDKDTASIRQIVAILKADEDLVGLFPEGGLQRDARELQPFEPGIGMIVRRTGALIVPVWIDGTPRKKSIVGHILTPSRSRVIFGKPYRVDPRMDKQTIIDDLKRRLLELAEATTPPYCEQCGYDLRGTIEAGRIECPECGHAFREPPIADPPKNMDEPQ